MSVNKDNVNRRYRFHGSKQLYKIIILAHKQVDNIDGRGNIRLIYISKNLVGNFANIRQTFCVSTLGRHVSRKKTRLSCNGLLVNQCEDEPT